ncbi:GNAT family N-acetyltransferase [Lacibacterium aquatile]|uniref:GNAT family N-acetyltransferase n=1 Tax=Lacibacterium aquatile TaxID=1168082 RepID=A0ABW5DW70_9PROT
MKVLETQRLLLRRFIPEDAPFILELLNDPGFIENIVDRGVRTIPDAEAYLVNGPLASYEKNGFGLYALVLKATAEPIGMCGLIRRDTLEDVDIGYALLARHCGQGYATEAARATLGYGLGNLGLKRVVAVTDPDNTSSSHVLEKIGMRFEKVIPWDSGKEEVKLYST